MNIDKAIEILAVLVDNKVSIPDVVLYDAMKLGIEALKGIKKVRKTFRPYVEALLPGETED